MHPVAAKRPVDGEHVADQRGAIDRIEIGAVDVVGGHRHGEDAAQRVHAIGIARARRRRIEPALPQQRAAVGHGVRLRHLHAGQRAVAGHHFQPELHLAVVAGGKGGQHRRGGVRLQQVVGVEEDHVGRGHAAQRVVVGRDLPAVGLADRLDAVAVAVQDLARAVRRAIVDHHDLHRRRGLGQRRVNRPAQKPRVVVVADDDGQARGFRVRRHGGLGGGGTGGAATGSNRHESQGGSPRHRQWHAPAGSGAPPRCGACRRSAAGSGTPAGSADR
ncbi:hypothetical protein D3C87_1404190 [compost metagenome]